nr:hypothetical protein [Desmospora activa]
MLKQGVHPEIVSERLGHTSISLTLDTHSHVIPRCKKMQPRCSIRCRLIRVNDRFH